MRNKKGDYKYGIILSLILGVMVLSLSLYFIFQELWSEDELDWEICRQSIQIRALLPDAEIKGNSVDSFKDSYPLKCKTNVVIIKKSDVKDIEDAQKIIAETMARCWALYDKGDSNAFPAKFFKSSVCVPCARIHLTEDAKEYLEEKKITGINIRESLMNLKMTKEYSYYEYLNNSGKKFSALNFGNGFPFDLGGDRFDSDVVVLKWKTDLVNRINGEEFFAWVVSDGVSLPEKFELDKGDLLINYGTITISGGEFGNYIPYLFYFQQGQTIPFPFEEVKEEFIFNLWKVPIEGLKSLFYLQDLEKNIFSESSVGLCEQWEGIPA